MPQSIRSFDRMIIPAPCDADWDSMIGNDQVRFCEHCKLHVTNLSSLTRQDAIRLVARSQGRLCVRFVQRPNGRVLTNQVPEKLHHIARRVSRIAAGAFTATLSLSSAAAQESAPTRDAPSAVQRLVQEKAKLTATSATLFGTITDRMGAVIAHATVTLINLDGNAEAETTSSDEGEYVFSNVGGGTYKLRITSPGFASFEVTSIEVTANSSGRFDASLEVARTYALAGAVAFVEPEEPLVKAAFKEDLQEVEKLAFASAVFETQGYWHGFRRGAPALTAMMRALWLKSEFSFVKKTNMTALEQAVENANLEIVRVLLRAGADVNATNETGGTPLMFLRDNATVDLVRELLSAGVKVNARDESGGTALMNAASQNKYEVVKELIEAGAKFDLHDTEGRTALMFAATNEDSRIAKLLIDAGADINETDHDGEAALSMAAEQGDPETVKILISFNANVNARDNNGWSALMYVAGTNDLESARALLNAGADLSVRDKDGKTTLALAREAKQPEMIKLLESRGAPE